MSEDWKVDESFQVITVQLSILSHIASYSLEDVVSDLNLSSIF